MGPSLHLHSPAHSFNMARGKSRTQKRASGLKVDLLNPSKALEQQLHKKKRLVQGPNSYFMDVKCPGCFNITTVFSHAQTVVQCGSCSTVLCQPTGGKARLTEGCSFRRKTSERSPALSMSMDRTDSALGFIHLLVRRKGPRSRITIDDDGMDFSHHH